MTLPLPTEGKVEQFKLHKEFPDKPFNVYKVRVRNDQGFIDAELPAKDAPRAGDEVTVEASEYGPKAKKKGGGFGGGGGRRGSDPMERASIESQVALKAAVELIIHDQDGDGSMASVVKPWITERLS